MASKGARGVGMKTMPLSHAESLEILEVSTSCSPKGLLQGLLYLSQAVYNITDRQCR
jgi:hypothetical protein